MHVPSASYAVDQNSPTIEKSEYLRYPLVPNKTSFRCPEPILLSADTPSMTETGEAEWGSSIIGESRYFQPSSYSIEMNPRYSKVTSDSFGVTSPTKTEETGFVVCFKIELTKPLAPFMTTLYLRAQQLIHLARRVYVFHAQSSYIARQGLNLVILLNDLVDAENGPDIEQCEGRNDLEDDLTELYEAMKNWGAQANEDEQVEYAEHRLIIKKQYSQLFKQRFYFSTRDQSRMMKEQYMILGESLTCATEVVRLKTARGATNRVTGFGDTKNGQKMEKSLVLCVERCY
ncbi:hypothetical protein M408DRAFT_313846 [Serendipita vermifera MAFF 305830]|uniref:Uncharacterized protein n=1 Tax=Serendipita vermifera MAFF 305830 TaxID=933852 RepID=A0A0C2WIG6_SERVB|nr:hypothetical protein M408DRAFT_313846 [Serendipita vermifera MAFF 305830]